MVDPTTVNIQLAQPTRGSDVGVWDTPVNNNTGILDTILGGISSIPLNNSNVVLSAGQFQSGLLLFNSTLTGNVVITFPTTFIMSYEIQNICTGTSAFTITLKTTATGGQVICCPPGEPFEVRNDGVNIRFKNFDRIGSYWDYAGTSVPNWVSGCTNPPYLNCDGTTFLSTQYPALAVIMGSTPSPGVNVTLPDGRGRIRGALNQTTGRMTLASGGVDGNTNYASGGFDSALIKSSNLPSNIPTADPGHKHVYIAPTSPSAAGGGGLSVGQVSTNTNPAFTGLIINPSCAAAGTDDPYPIMQPTYIGGLTLIRAA